VDLDFAGQLVFWKGPSPWYFVPIPDRESAEIESVARYVTYGWGVIPVTARIGATEWQTSLFPREGTYYVPVKAWVRKAEALDLGDQVGVRLTVEGA